MSANGVADRVLEAVEAGDVDVLIVNFANADMVGHTGMLEPAIKAVETVDACLGRVATAILARDGAVLITADHGNAERMVDPVTGEPHTAHTTNLVPFVVLTNDWRGNLRAGGSLEDIAPTLLGLLGLPPSPQMTGTDLRR